MSCPICAAEEEPVHLVSVDLVKLKRILLVDPCTFFRCKCQIWVLATSGQSFMYNSSPRGGIRPIRPPTRPYGRLKGQNCCRVANPSGAL